MVSSMCAAPKALKVGTLFTVSINIINSCVLDKIEKIVALDKDADEDDYDDEDEEGLCIYVSLIIDFKLL